MKDAINNIILLVTCTLEALLEESYEMVAHLSFVGYSGDYDTIAIFRMHNKELHLWVAYTYADENDQEAKYKGLAKENLDKIRIGTTSIKVKKTELRQAGVPDTIPIEYKLENK